jgi:hypothetical protein
MFIKKSLVTVLMISSFLASAQKHLSLSIGTLPSTNYSSVRVKALTKYNVTGQIGTIHKGPVSNFWFGTNEHVFATIGVQSPTFAKFSVGTSFGGVMDIHTDWTMSTLRMIFVSDLDYQILKKDKYSWKVGTTLHTIPNDNSYMLPTITYTRYL